MRTINERGPISFVERLELVPRHRRKLRQVDRSGPQIALPPPEEQGVVVERCDLAG
jgi:hypothetical protein